MSIPNLPTSVWDFFTFTLSYHHQKEFGRIQLWILLWMRIWNEDLVHRYGCQFLTSPHLRNFFALTLSLSPEKDWKVDSKLGKDFDLRIRNKDLVQGSRLIDWLTDWFIGYPPGSHSPRRGIASAGRWWAQPFPLVAPPRPVYNAP